MRQLRASGRRALRSRHFTFWLYSVLFIVIAVYIMFLVKDIDKNEKNVRLQFKRRQQFIRHGRRMLPLSKNPAYRDKRFDDAEPYTSARPTGRDTPTAVEGTQIQSSERQNTAAKDLSPFEVSYIRRKSSSTLKANNGEWQTVAGTMYTFFVYSAFYDNRSSTVVRVVGTTMTRFPERLWCRLFYTLSSSDNANEVPYFQTVLASINIINEHWEHTYSACFIVCPLEKYSSPPKSVSILGHLSSKPANKILVHQTYEHHHQTDSITRPVRIAMCVKPLDNDYNKALNMLEFLELNIVLGVTQFFMYNHAIGPEVECILQDYVRRGIVTLLPWHLDLEMNDEISDEGTIAAMNDCMYRSMFRYSYTVITDLDKYIIPRPKLTLQGLTDWLRGTVKTANGGCYSFQKTLFYLEWQDDPSVTSIDGVGDGLVTLHKTRRTAMVYPHGYHSKYMCRPEYVVEAGNYLLWKFIPGRYMINVRSNVALLHHYGTCDLKVDHCIKQTFVIDRTLHRYREILTERVTTGWKELETKCYLKINRSKSRQQFYTTFVNKN